MNEPIEQLVKRAAALRRDGRSGVACLVVEARGSTPQSAGALMLVDDAANTYGTIGGGCVEAEVRRRALAMLGAGASGVCRFKLDHDYGWDDGLICGGTLALAIAPLPPVDRLERLARDLEARRPATLELRVETDDGPALYTLHLPPRERLLIAGAGHVGQAVARIALGLDFDVTMFDDRSDLLEKLAPPGAATVTGEIAAALGAATFDEATYALVVTRGHRHDEQALEAVLGRGARYVGMIGSRRKVKLIFDDLRSRGATDEALAAVDAPVGLDIGAVTVEEIAVSIAAQLVARRRRDGRPSVRGPVAPPAAASTARR